MCKISSRASAVVCVAHQWHWRYNYIPQKARPLYQIRIDIYRVEYGVQCVEIDISFFSMQG